jgi:hypothetical protein
VYVYGGSEDADRRVALEIGGAEGLDIQAIDKGKLPVLRPHDTPGHVERNYVHFDGWKPSGIFDSGIDSGDRRQRVSDVGAIVIGSGGEIYRNFFYLFDKSFSARELVATFYSRFDPNACTAEFDERRYVDTLAAQIIEDVGASGDRLDRSEVELVYPLFRLKYWTARDVVINHRFGWAIYPFMYPELICGSPTIPIRWKSFGLFESLLIRSISSRIASYQSAYGFPFDRDPPAWYRLQMLPTYCRPPWLRRYSYRVKKHRAEARPLYLSADHLGTVMDPSLPRLSELFRIARINDPEAFGRVATLEYLLERHKRLAADRHRQ